jgi:hypothetical protein
VWWLGKRDKNFVEQGEENYYSLDLLSVQWRKAILSRQTVVQSRD